ncbi:competence/damage-inducible protein A [Neobacillus vireti]|uniref:Putative competence-damage inducible protein n=1 Tax=Neobacillus vireti LMG 21834 TaxID=1131730 RepID=A0AB94INY1_9BACI|nr:competence/damage-inducible protein A [Neobacillus vireti]ETI68786.1 competence damage-inducible protein A [Neobacillus vireti LMG 21834]KLT19572.1 damage-inducible protein CinA [Neobacillus vireti]
MNAEIIAVGSELLLGQIVNTNARFLSQHLAGLGIDVYYHTVVGDNPDRLKAAIAHAEARSEIIIFTGGLGPTKDDLTKETIARHLGKELVMDETALASIELYFKRTNRVMTENNRKQALVLEGSQILANDHGMAPGMVLETGGHIYMLLPGPPKEMEPMFLQYGGPALSSKSGSNEKIVSRVLRFFGIGEAALETEVMDIIEAQSNPTIAPLAGDGEVTLRLTAKHPDENIAHTMLDDVEKKINQRVGEFLYGYDNISLLQELTKALKKRNLTVTAAESLTGGLFQQELTAISGASSVFKGGVVCYSNEVKQHILQVNQETLEKHGAVSEQCARELAENAARILAADVGISFTGVAGPDELEGKPVGTVYIGIAVKKSPTIVEKITLSGTRDAIRNRAVKFGCYFLLKNLKESQNAK